MDNPIGLPSDFFDRKSDSDARNVQTEESEKVIDEDVKNLPVGFFDDPKMDSKVQCLRKTVRSKDDEQWNEFQREMAVEQSKLIEPEVDLDDKLEQLQHERDLDEVGEQLEYWKRINELEKKKSEKQLAKPMQIDADENKSQSKSNSETEDDDEGLEEEFTSWRNKPKVRP